MVPAAAQPDSKTFVEMYEDGEGGGRRMRTHQLVVGKSWCPVCGEWRRPAGTPNIAGTWYGPVLLSKLIVLYALPATDRRVARGLRCLL